MFFICVVILIFFVVGIVCLMLWLFGVEGWVIGCYIGESVVLIGMLFGVCYYFYGSGGFNCYMLFNWSIILLGIMVNLVLFVCLFCDNLLILVLVVVKVLMD